jgi:hypothetical protein
LLKQQIALRLERQQRCSFCCDFVEKQKIIFAWFSEKWQFPTIHGYYYTNMIVTDVGTWRMLTKARDISSI